MTTPNPHNFCGGNFTDWLEVLLLPECNGRCSWCIEKKGFHPTLRARWSTIAEAAIKSGEQNIILLGGEPTLYNNLYEITRFLKNAGKTVWITTNGSRLTPEFVRDVIPAVYGVNISIHHFDLKKNAAIVGVDLDRAILAKAVEAVHHNHGVVRLNCNCIRGHIDTGKQIKEYVRFAQSLKVDNVRFAELKDDDDSFVDLAAILGHKYGLNDDPFVQGCNTDAVILGMPVNFRQMCGLQTRLRTLPVNPQQAVKKVLYYDGKIYPGWQIKQEKAMMTDKADTDKEVVRILKQVRHKEIGITEAAMAIARCTCHQTKREDSKTKQPKKIVTDNVSGSGSGCGW